MGGLETRLSEVNSIPTGVHNWIMNKSANSSAGHLICVFCILLTLLVSCNSQTPLFISSTSTTTATKEPVPTITPTIAKPTPTAAGEPELEGVISLWHSWNETETQGLIEIIDRFQNLHPGVLFDVLYIPFEELRTKYEATVESGQGPMALLGPSEWGPLLFDRGFIQELTGYFNPGVLNSLNQAVLAEGEYHGALIGLPYSAQGVQLFRNKNIIPQPPGTFDDLVSSAQTATQGGNIGAFLDRGIFFSWAHLQGIGGQLIDEDGNPAFNTVEGVEWLNLMKSFENAGLVEFNGDQDTELFLEGRVGFIIDGSWNNRVYSETLGSDAISIDPWPIYQNGYLSGYVKSDNLFLNVHIEESDRSLSIAFLESFLDPEVQSILSMVGFIPTVNNSLVSDFLIQQSMGAFTKGTPYPILPEAQVYWDILSGALVSVFDGDVDPAVALQNANDEIKTKLDEFQPAEK